MKLWESAHIFDHSWLQVTAANWRKYPNPFNPSVVSIDILDRRVTPEGTLITKRLICTDFKLPDWLRKMVGNTHTYVTEESEVDPVKQTLVMRSRNVTLNQILSIEEHLTYSPLLTDPSKTKLSQEARINVSLKFNDYLEAQVAKTMTTNAAKGRQAMEHVLGLLEEEVRDLAGGLLPNAACHASQPEPK